MRIWNLLLIYSSWSDAAKKVDENDTAVGEKNVEVYLKDVLPQEDYKEVEKDVKKTQMQEKLKV